MSTWWAFIAKGGLVTSRATLESHKPSVQCRPLCEPIQHLDEFKRDSIVKVVMSKYKQALYFSRATIPYDRDAAKQVEQTLHKQAFRHLGLYAFTAWNCSKSMWHGIWVHLKARKPRATACFGKMDIVLHWYRRGKLYHQVWDTQEDLDRLNAMDVAHFAW